MYHLVMANIYLVLFKPEVRCHRGSSAFIVMCGGRVGRAVAFCKLLDINRVSTYTVLPNSGMANS